MSQTTFHPVGTEDCLKVANGCGTGCPLTFILCLY